MLRSALLAKLGVTESKNLKKLKSPEKIKSKKRKLLEKCVENDDFELDEELSELESKFRVKVSDTRKALEGIITLTSNNPKRDKQLFGDEQLPIFVQINTIKVPKTHSKIARISLKHSILGPDSEVCLIAPDVKGIPNKNHEDHLDHYEKLLARKGVSGIKKIMTFHEFRTEYETFEMRSKLVELYDAFLVDGRISGKTVSKCGKIFYKKRKVPTSIKLQATNLKKHIEDALKKTPLHLHGKSDSFVVQIGHSKMPCNHLIENVFEVLRNIDKTILGGFSNVRSLNLFTKGVNFPIYTTLKNKNQVHVPRRKKEKIDQWSDELSTRVDVGVTVTADGEVTTFPLDNE